MREANPLNIAQIDHVVIRVRDLDNMVAFYETVLGCRLERGPGELRLAQLRAGNALIDLVDAAGPLGRKAGKPPLHSAPNMDHLCLQVVPWEEAAILAHLERHGVKFGAVETRYGAGGMGPSIYLEDPEGNTIELKCGGTGAFRG